MKYILVGSSYEMFFGSKEHYVESFSTAREQWIAGGKTRLFREYLAIQAMDVPLPGEWEHPPLYFNDWVRVNEGDHQISCNYPDTESPVAESNWAFEKYSGCVTAPTATQSNGKVWPRNERGYFIKEMSLASLL